MKQKILLFMLGAIFCLPAFAQDEDNVYEYTYEHATLSYTVDEQTMTAATTKGRWTYIGKVSIPSKNRG